MEGFRFGDERFLERKKRRREKREPFGLVRVVRLPMGRTNSVAVFVRAVGKLLGRQGLRIGDFVLLHNSLRDIKLEGQWLGPYRIREVSDAGYYRLSEMDGAEMKGLFAENRLKSVFFRRGEG